MSTKMERLRIGTRGSTLALAQAHWAKRRLETESPGWLIDLVTIKTSGDRLSTLPIKAASGKGIFVKEIEEALLQGKIDVAVHSMKDLPTEIRPGLCVAAIAEREDPRDVLVSLDGKGLRDLMPGARIGTGSLRRQAQVSSVRRDLAVVPIAGNVDTRLKKLDRKEVDALILAAAGLKRIGEERRISEYLPPEVCVSAVAQGALCLETRQMDPINERVVFLHHFPTAVEVTAERAFLKELGGGCGFPIGARAWSNGVQVRLTGFVADPKGTKRFRGDISGLADESERLGKDLALRLLKQGATQVISQSTSTARTL